MTAYAETRPYSAAEIQWEMNMNVRSDVQKSIPGFVATTVDYSERKKSFEFHVFVRGEALGLEGDYRLDWAVSADKDATPLVTRDDLKKIWDLMGQNLRLDAEEIKNGRTK